MRAQPTFAKLTSGLKLHYRVQGNPEGPWLVLLNGLLSDTTMWAGVLPGLSDAFRILTFDSRGQGRSDAPPEGPYPTALLAEEAWELFGQLNVRRPWLIGLSNGSAMSLELLSSRPEAFAGAVLTSAMPSFDFALSLKAEHWAHCLEVGGPLMQFDAVAPFLWGDTFLEARHGVLRAYHQVVTGGNKPMHGNLHQIRGTLGWDIRDRLDRIQAPVLLLSGAEDLLTPPWKCLETARRIPHSRFEIVPGIGHAYPVENPKGFVAQVRAFITGIQI
ncbi:alpha/beta hydrolase [Geothrix limicola]|uniref:Alpha/beta hydrolase n=1 Tax=Geothrix limicola TaxID=2927978 RepID=A0ABQ5QAS0_9BACT|nr:alpha/beta fold hydrolase [Geothrix limicola]GLH71917.1 alpha/beta hydrolase [Geothrix limicola]